MKKEVRQLLEQAGIDPASAKPADIRLAIAASKQPEIFARSKKHLEHLPVFGSFKAALIAAGAL